MATSPQFDVTPQKEGSITNFLYRQWNFTPEKVTGVNLDGKTAIVTGSNTGIGLEVSRQLLELGLGRLILAVRSEDKGKAATKDLLKTTDTKATIAVWKLDLASYDSVCAFADRTQTLDRLDFAILNAGIVKTETKLNESTGHDETIQVNYLSTMLLAILLLQKAKLRCSTQGRPTRITITSSDVAGWTGFKEKSKVPLIPACDTPGGDPTARMMVSKLLGQFFVAELAKRVPSSAAVVNCATPGMVYDSEFNRDINLTFGGKLARIVTSRLGYTASVGARHITDAAVRHDDKEIHGQYLSTQKLKPMAPIIYSEQGKQIANQLWKETMAELSFAKAEEIISEINNA